MGLYLLVSKCSIHTQDIHMLVMYIGHAVKIFRLLQPHFGHLSCIRFV